METFDNISVDSTQALPRYAHTATAVGNRIYVFGGVVGGTLSNEVQILDSENGKWTAPMVLGTKPSPRGGHSAVALNNDCVLIVGGSAEPKDNIWFLEVDTPFVKQQRKVQGKEVVAWSKGVIGANPQPVIISGPSGVGKGTLITKLMEEFPSTFGFSVSHTTRLPREKELAGIHYHFTEREKMEIAVQEGKFLEYANVHGNIYGTSIAAVEAVADAGKRCILDIDVQGARSIRNRTLDALFIFVSPPSFEELEKRLRGRGTEREDQVQKRLSNAKAEIELAKSSALFDHILVNDDLEACYSKLKNILGLSSESIPSSNGYFQSSSQDIEIYPRHSTTLLDKKLIVYGGLMPDGIASGSIHILDLSTIKGGAPGRTQGLQFGTFDQNKTDQLMSGFTGGQIILESRHWILE